MPPDQSGNSKETLHTIAVLVENKFGVLAKVASLFSARGYNIDSLCVGVTQDPSVSRITMVTRGDEKILEQIRKQLSKLIDTIKVMDLMENESIDRELVLIKITAPTSKRVELLQIVEIFRARIVDMSTDNMIIEVTGDQGKVRSDPRFAAPIRGQGNRPNRKSGSCPRPQDLEEQQELTPWPKGKGALVCPLPGKGGATSRDCSSSR